MSDTLLIRCAACGAPLVKSRSVFSKPVLWGIVGLFLLLEAFCVLPRLFVR